MRFQIIFQETTRWWDGWCHSYLIFSLFRFMQVNLNKETAGKIEKLRNKWLGNLKARQDSVVWKFLYLPFIMIRPLKIQLSIAGIILIILISCSDAPPEFPTEAEVELMYASCSSAGSSSSRKTSSSSLAPSSSSLEFSSSSEQQSSSSEFSSSSERQSSSSYVPMCGSTEYNPPTHFCDTRDNKIYKWVEIGGQVWMAQNLNYKAAGSKCY